MQDRIGVNPQIHFGKTVRNGNKDPRADVLELVREGISFSHIIADYYPDLTLDDIRACRAIRK